MDPILIAARHPRRVYRWRESCPDRPIQEVSGSGGGNVSGAGRFDERGGERHLTTHAPDANRGLLSERGGFEVRAAADDARR